jgi:ABC-type molybdate transport system permease subunit
MPLLLWFVQDNAAFWNSVLTGVALALLALGHRTKNRSRTGLDILLGIWLVLSPFVLGYQFSSATWSSIVIGLLVVFINGTARPVFRGQRPS